jgi:L-lactate dehydrogenase (cytochrome)/(S)-mandelate dehydrogenase
MDEAALRRLAHNVADMRALARRRLPRGVFDFCDGGAEDEQTLRRNETAFDEHVLWPRPLQGAEHRDQSVEIFGHRLPSPVIIGPTGIAGLLWPRGEIHAARAARAAGTLYVSSHASGVTIEDLGREVPGNLWMQVFVYRDRSLTQHFVERAAAAGFDGLVLTIDNQVPGNRERDLRNGFTIPPRWRLGNLIDMGSRWQWLLATVRGPRFTLANYPSAEGDSMYVLAARMAKLLDPGLSWRDVEWLRGLWKGPFLLKGVLHPAEARRAVELGVDGIIVSNHGGRQLDGAPASLVALPHVVDAVAGRILVLMDGGVRRGADVVKALALGARACLIGRPQLWGLATAGETGVSRILEIFRDEIDRVMALGGWDKLADIDRSALTPTEP